MRQPFRSFGLFVDNSIANENIIHIGFYIFHGYKM